MKLQQIFELVKGDHIQYDGQHLEIQEVNIISVPLNRVPANRYNKDLVYGGEMLSGSAKTTGGTFNVLGLLKKAHKITL